MPGSQLVGVAQRPILERLINRDTGTGNVVLARCRWRWSRFRGHTSYPSTGEPYLAGPLQSPLVITTDPVSANKRRIAATDEGNLVGNLRGEVGETITTWALWRIYRIQELRLQTPDVGADLANKSLRLLSVVVDRLRDDLTARLSELGEQKTGCLNFHFLADKRPEFRPEAIKFEHFVDSKGIREKRHRDISHKELPPKWEDHRHRYVYDRVLTRATALALRTMKIIDRRIIGPESPYLWRVMRSRRYEPMNPPSSGYLIMPHIALPDEVRRRLDESE